MRERFASASYPYALNTDRRISSREGEQTGLGKSTTSRSAGRSPREDNGPMRAAAIRALGGQVEQLQLPAPPDPSGDEVPLEVRAAGIGNWDDLVRTGAWNVGTAPTMALGVEAAGGCVRSAPRRRGSLRAMRSSFWRTASDDAAR